MGVSSSPPNAARRTIRCISSLCLRATAAGPITQHSVVHGCCTMRCVLLNGSQGSGIIPGALRQHFPATPPRATHVRLRMPFFIP